MSENAHLKHAKDLYRDGSRTTATVAALIAIAESVERIERLLDSRANGGWS